MKSKRTKLTSIPAYVKIAVWIRDNGACIICGTPYANPNAHIIPRSRGGLGVTENIVTLCAKCHHEFDNGMDRQTYTQIVYGYIKDKYSGWEASKYVYRKY